MENWVIWAFITATLLHITAFWIINITKPKWRKQKYLLPVVIFLFGAALLSVGVMILMDLLLIVVGTLLLLSAGIGVVIGLIIDFFTRHKISYR